MKPFELRFGFLSALPIWVFLIGMSPVLAEVVQDGTLPHPSVVTSEGNTTVITGGTQTEQNLFHSFRSFSVRRGGTASFRGVDRSIANIFSRVTGRGASRINGRIEALQADGTVSPANFFLLNPNGIIFGPHASLNVGGSFLATTAQQIDFADGARFSAAASQTSPLLTIRVPTGLQFGNRPGNVVNRSVEPITDGSDPVGSNAAGNPARGLSVGSNQTLALIGGNVRLPGGQVFTAGGRIELGSVDRSTQVSLVPVSSGWALNYRPNADSGRTDAGNIQLSQGAGVVSSGPAGGAIQVQARRIRLSDGSQIISQTQGAQPGRTLRVNATDEVTTIGISADGQSLSGFLTLASGPGAAGTLRIVTDRLQARAGAQNGSVTRGSGRAGDVNIRAREIDLNGVARDAKGEPILRDTSFLPSSLITATTANSSGNAGTLRIETQRLRLSQGGAVNATAFGEGNAGNLIIQADDSIDLRGGFNTALLALSQSPSSVGFRPGTIRLTTEKLAVREGASITVSSINSASDAGGAGNLEIQAQTIVLDNGGELAATTQSGTGGDIRLQVENLLLLQRESSITTSAGVIGAGGNGGSITIDARNGFIVSAPLENADITANAFQGSGGKIEITTQGIFGLEQRSLAELQQLLNSDNPNQLQPAALPTSDITAISQTSPALSGQIILNTPDADLSRGLVELPTNLVDAANLITRACPTQTAPVATELSKFVLTGRGGLPPSPVDQRGSDAVLTGWATLGTREGAAPMQREDPQGRGPQGRDGRTGARPADASTAGGEAAIVEAQGWRVDSMGKVTLVAQASMVTPHPSVFSSPTCGGN